MHFFVYIELLYYESLNGIQYPFHLSGVMAFLRHVQAKRAVYVNMYYFKVIFFFVVGKLPYLMVQFT